MRNIGVLCMMVMVSMSAALKPQVCQCPCACAPDGTKLKNLLNCFATWEKNVATNNQSKLDGCSEKDVVYCKTTDGNFCKFDGTNNLVETNDKPECYFSCGMGACTSWLVAHKPEQVKCIADVYKDDDSNRFLRF